MLAAPAPTSARVADSTIWFVAAVVDLINR
jgi:hypothetical protein